MTHKKQHFVPASYLKAWCDKTTPENYDPYVWVFQKKGGDPKNRPPVKIFWEKDFYTLNRDGQRNLAIEKLLSKLENQFTTLRQKKLNKKISLSTQEHRILCDFIAVMYARTKSRRNQLSENWQQVLDMGMKFSEWTKTASSEDLEHMSHALRPHNNESSMSLDEVKSMVENPLPTELLAALKVVSPALQKMQSAIFYSTHPSTFITSDNPCSWFDPDLYKSPTPFGAGGLISHSIEISMPLSPTQYIMFGKKLIFDGLFFPIKEEDPLIELINRRTWENSDEYFIANQNRVNLSWQK